MTSKELSARLAALAFACALVASCEARSTTDPTTGGGGSGSGGIPDNSPPTVKVTGTPKDTVYLGGAPFSVTVIASDNIGVATLQTTARNGGAVVTLQADSNKTAVPSMTQVISVPISGYNKGDRIVVRATTTDAALNSATDSVVVTVADTTAPKLGVASSQSGRTIKGLDSVDVQVSAADSAGIAYAGYRLLLVRPTDSLLVRKDSLLPPARSNLFSPTFGFRISDTLPIGTYVLQAFGADRSGIPARAPLSVTTFSLTDAQTPTVAFTKPTSAGKVAVGDSILVTTVLHDNAGISSVVLSAFSARGNPALGTQDTATRYTPITAPTSATFRSGLKDTTITRWLKATTPIDTATDSIVVRARVSDATGNVGSATIRLRMVPTLAISSSRAGQALRSRDTVDVRVTAGDTSGVSFLGYRLLRSTDSSVVSADSVSGGGGFNVTNIFKLTLPDTLTPGNFFLRGFSRVISPVATRTSQGPGFSMTDSLRPSQVVRAPQNLTTLRVGDSLLVVDSLHDNVGVARVTFRAFSVRGNPALGTADTVERYTSVSAPSVTGSFSPPPRDTVITRYLRVVTPIDSLSDTLYVVATVTDVSGFTNSVTRRVLMTNGPKVIITSPAPGDSLVPKSPFTVSVTATSKAGVKRIIIVTKSDPSWPTAVSDSVDQLSAPVSDSVVLTRTITIPANAPPKGQLTVTARAFDVNDQPGVATPVTVAVRVSLPPAPLVKQQVAPRMELTDPVIISASGNLLTWVGFELFDRNNVSIKRDSGHVSPAGTSSYSLALPLGLSTIYQGQKIFVKSFARDSAGRIGYAVPAGTQTPQTDPNLALRDSTLVVYGQTFVMPRAGVAGDITIDSTRGNVFISNTKYNRLERWNAGSSAFDPTGVAVGSEPWGMVMQTDNDTLLVANSGGTNISKVCVNTTKCGSIGEILGKRILTRNMIVQTVTQTRDPATGKIALSLSAPISYSDRPQYVQQSAGGRLFYSTKPTTSAPAGTIRWLDPTLPVPDPRQVYQYAEKTPTNVYAVFNADSMKVIKFITDPSKSDELIIYDHIYGQKTGGSCTSPQQDGSNPTVADAICGRDSVVTDAVVKVNAQGGDVEARLDIDVDLLGLTDTTFVASSGDRSWIGFGEGNTKGGVGRVMLANDVAGDPRPRFFSPGVTVRDLTDNASEPVFGMGLDKFGSTVAAHGTQSYFAALENPFHLRLQGKYDSFDAGAGITFHPNADLRSGFVSSSRTDSTRTAFVASANGAIEVVDAAFYINRGSLQIKNNLYGPIRATLPFATDNVGIPSTDPRYVVLKLFGLTNNGLVVINLRASDIQPVP